MESKHQQPVSQRQRQPVPSEERSVVERLVPVWLEETARHDSSAAREARAGWEQGRLSDEAAANLAHWVTARVTDTGFNEDEGPHAEGPVRITPADKETVHRWLTAQGHTI
ncbi:hypothetical protein [Streptomyces sp. NL15-2K]|uniref:hypothetical protein n=1 Tax=Streptomyces sp. NL15-2K TaxID=376149 RepID=UPI000F55CB27|nr:MULTISPECIES: hypothetical protein [Actinomycetes]WKX06389.1 hypothetical protein Q4V64_02345 [Kutzneria buriramensis]